MTKYMSIPKWGLAIDWETSGFTPVEGQRASKHQGLAIGAVIFDIVTLTPVETFYKEIQFDSKYEWSPVAERIHGLTREFLAEHGSLQQDVAFELGSLVMKYINAEPIITLGHRVIFDLEFTDQLMSSIGIKFDYDLIKIDTAALATVFLGVQTSNELFELCGLPARTEHDALEDILFTLECARLIKQGFLGN